MHGTEVRLVDRTGRILIWIVAVIRLGLNLDHRKVRRVEGLAVAFQRLLIGSDRFVVLSLRVQGDAEVDVRVRPVRIDVYTDSTYVKDGVTKWLAQWKINGWKTAAKKPVKNVDLWQRLEAALAEHQVEWLWIKGHAGDPGNERADALANKGMAEFLS